MNKRITLIIIILLSLAIGGCSKSRKNRVYLKNNCFYVELAKTPGERARGLMFREHLDPDRGMLFIFDTQDIHSFWMKNTPLALDIIWIDRYETVAYIAKNSQPCAKDPCPGVEPDKKAKYVLEVLAGTCEKIGLTVGNKIRIDIN